MASGGVVRGSIRAIAAFPPRPREATRYFRSLDAWSLGVWVVAAAAAALRWHGINAEGLWLDEIASYEYAVQRYGSAVELVTTVPTVDPHPPLYYLLLRWWAGLFGTTEVALRSLSAALSVATVLFVYLLAVKLFDSRATGHLASAFVAASAMHVYFAQEARMYALLTLLTVASFYWYVDLVLADDVRPASVSRYVAATALLGYAHTFAVFLILAQNVFALVLARREVATDGDGRLGWIPRLRRSDLFRRWVGYQVVVGALLAPWLALLAAHALELPLVAYSTTDWIPSPSLAYFFRAPRAYLFYSVREFRFFAHPWVVWPAIGLAAAALLRFNPDADPEDDADEIELGYSDRSLLLAVWLAVGTVVPLVLSYLLDPIYRHKYTIGASLAFFLMAARGVEKLDANYSRWFAYGLAALVVVAAAGSLGGIYDAQQKPDWREGIAELEAEAGDSALVVTSPGFVAGPIEYYADGDRTTIRAIPKNATWNGTLSAVVGDRPTVWLAVSTWYIERGQVQYLLNEFEDGGYERLMRGALAEERRGDSPRAVLEYGVVAYELHWTGEGENGTQNVVPPRVRTPTATGLGVAANR
ncbi:MAG: glycosyltransferase family 39 protein [Haloarculaceae archaeon]